MSDKPMNDNSQSPEASEAADAEAQGRGPATDSAGASGEFLDDAAYEDVELDRETLEASAAELMAEVEQLQERLLRSTAELENTRRRAEREKIDAGRYAIANFARDLLSVSDNFERALSAAPEDASSVSTEALSGLLTGVRMTERELLTVLARHGVKRSDPKGEKFDPNLHQAVAQAPAVGVPAGNVAQTAQTGFVLGDRILRAAMVIVSTGEPEDPPMAVRPDPIDQTADDSGADDGPTGRRLDTSV